ncbi:MAG: acyltransferase [Salinivirgaceae bacterium]|nr:acyltransferase [Salinivirgaceae bacterium]
MITLYIIVFIIALWGIKPRRNEQERLQYMSKDSTDAIKGIFILLVFFRHANEYVKKSGFDYSSLADSLFSMTDSFLNQLIVVMFLFFSGYGIIYSISNKGDSYISNIPKHRILNTLLNFDIAVACFIILSFIIGHSFDTKTIILSFTGWESVGNSNWYIFVILICYLSTWLVFALNRGNRSILTAALLNFGLLMIATIALALAGKPSHWYNTIFAYPIGMMFGLFKERFDSLVNKKYAACLIGAVICFAISTLLFFDKNLPIGENSRAIINGSSWVIRVISFIIIILMVMTKFNIQNKTLIWLGGNLFPLYIYQRIPMIIISTYFDLNPTIFIIISILITCALIPIYRKIQFTL